jgi:hypothetical protein
MLSGGRNLDLFGRIEEAIEQIVQLVPKPDDLTSFFMLGFQEIHDLLLQKRFMGRPVSQPSVSNPDAKSFCSGKIEARPPNGIWNPLDHKPVAGPCPITVYAGGSALSLAFPKPFAAPEIAMALRNGSPWSVEAGYRKTSDVRFTPKAEMVLRKLVPQQAVDKHPWGSASRRRPLSRSPRRKWRRLVKEWRSLVHMIRMRIPAMGDKAPLRPWA